MVGVWVNSEHGTYLCHCDFKGTCEACKRHIAGVEQVEKASKPVPGDNIRFLIERDTK